MRNLLKALSCIFLLVACAPHVEQAGPQTRDTAFTDTHYLTTDDTALPLHQWIPDEGQKAILIAVHGFSDYGHFVLPGFAEYLQANNIHLITYDQRGFGDTMSRGLWAGHDTMADDLANLIKLTQKTYPTLPLYIMGESMGGAVVIETLAQHKDLPIKGAILSAPAVWSMDDWPWYQKAGLYAFSYTMPWLKLSGGGIVQPTDHMETWKTWSRDPLVLREIRVDSLFGVSKLMTRAANQLPEITSPILFLYGENDEVIPAAPVQRIAPHFKDSITFALYKEGWHMLTRDHNGPVVWQDIHHWITSRTTPLPSKADIGTKERLMKLP
jgi:acylglycerol lipase